MPWLFRRRTVRRVVRASGQDWARVPALSPVVDPRAPVLGPLLETPEVAGTEDLLRRAGSAAGPEAEPVRGTVTGVVRRRVAPAPTLEPRRRRLRRLFGSPDGRLAGDDLVEESDVVDVMYDEGGEPAAGDGAKLVRREADEPSAMPVEVRELGRRVAPVVLRVRAESLPLTTVSAETVGSPQESAEPFRSIGPYERMLAQYEANDVLGIAALAGLSSVAAPPPDPAPTEPIQRAAPVVRRTLAESRRQGLQAATIAGAAGESAELEGSSMPSGDAQEVREDQGGVVPVDDAERSGRSNAGVEGDAPGDGGGPGGAAGLVVGGSEPLLPTIGGDQTRFSARPGDGSLPAGPRPAPRSSGLVGADDSSRSSDVADAGSREPLGSRSPSMLASGAAGGKLISAGALTASVPTEPPASLIHAEPDTTSVALGPAEAAVPPHPGAASAFAESTTAPALAESITAADSSWPLAASTVSGPLAAPTASGSPPALIVSGSPPSAVSFGSVEAAVAVTAGALAAPTLARPDAAAASARPVDPAVLTVPTTASVSAGPGREASSAGPIVALAHTGPMAGSADSGRTAGSAGTRPIAGSAYTGPIARAAGAWPIVGPADAGLLAADVFAGSAAGAVFGRPGVASGPGEVTGSAGMYEFRADSSSLGLHVLTELVHRPQPTTTDAVEDVELWSLERDAPELAAAMGTAGLNGPQYGEPAYDNELPPDSTVTQPSFVPPASYGPAAFEVPGSGREAAYPPVPTDEEERFEVGPEWLLGLPADPGLLGRVAERLYPAVRRRLRSELLVDRERRGALADLR